MRRLCLILAVITAAAAAAGHADEPPANPMHPPFAPLDGAGQPAILTGGTPSSIRTCGGCHDADAINRHNSHWTDQVKVDCVSCHFDAGRFPQEPSAYDEHGRIRREAMVISAPSDEHCASCHGIVHTQRDPLRIPSDFGPGASNGRSYGLTLRTGVILSAQNLSESFLNIQGKAERAYPWDIHSQRLVGCVSCHHAANHPVKSNPKRDRIDFLAEDPRRTGLADYLRRPDHRLAAAECRSCHDPLRAHDFLPYKQRHLEALACQACHTPQLFGPAARMIDSTVATIEGGPRLFLRGAGEGGAARLNAAPIAGYSPILLSSSTAGRDHLAPYNATDIWSWSDGATGRSVSWNTVRRAFVEDGAYAPAVVAALDRNADGDLAGSELALDTPERSAAIARRLEALGVERPVIALRTDLSPLNHGVLAGRQVSRGCDGCHSGDGSRLRAGLALSHYIPGGSLPADGEIRGSAAAGARVESTAEGTRILPSQARGLHVFGHARGGWSDRLGFGLFLAAILAAGIHAAIRFATQRNRGAAPAEGDRVYLYTLYERIWHWLMAGSVLVLMITGFQIHFAGPTAWLPLPRAVTIHNIFAVVLTANGFLSLFYHVTTRAIRHFLPHPDGLLARTIDQARFYTSGIFLGRPHPSPKTAERKLNPLQQVTYLSLLNLLFPLQVITGAIIWGAARWPDAVGRIGGLTVVAPLHNVGAWIFLAFLVVHIYLTTTGHTVLANIRAMVSGYDLVHPAPEPANRSTHASVEA